MAKVSIIIPIYNVEMYLEECLDSVKNQTLQDVEIICVNDGSTDSSLDIIKRYANDDDRFVIIDKENGGYGKGMNDGLDKATGEYIGIVEPDDYVLLSMYEDLYSIACENDLDFVKADFYRFKTDKKTNEKILTYNQLDRSGEYYGKVLNPSEEPFLTTFILNTWSGIYRRSFIEEHHIRHNETPGASFQDNGFFWQTFIYAKRAMFINKPYYMNRRDNPNSSVKSREKVYCMNIEYDYIRDIFMQPGNEELWERFKTYYNRKRFANYEFTFSRIGKEFKPEYIRRFSKEFRRADELDELDMGVFTRKQQRRLQSIMSNPDKYYLKYRIKKIVKFIPRKIKGLLRRIKKLFIKSSVSTYG